MYRFKLLLAAGMLAAFLSVMGATSAWSQTRVHRALHSKVTADERQASNNLMSSALTDLSSAQNAGNSSQASSSLNSAISKMSQALPIYHGYRIKAIGSARRALRQMSRRKGVAKASSSVGQAVSDAKTALQNDGDEVTE